MAGRGWNRRDWHHPSNVAVPYRGFRPSMAYFDALVEVVAVGTIETPYHTSPNSPSRNLTSKSQAPSSLLGSQEPASATTTPYLQRDLARSHPCFAAAGEVALATAKD